MASAKFPRCSSKICEDIMEKVHMIIYKDSSLWASNQHFRLSFFSLNHYRITAKRTGREETHNKHKLKFITDAQYTNCHTDMTSVCTWTVNTNACAGTKRRQQQKYCFVFLTAHLPAPLISFLFTWLLQSMSYYRTLTISPTHLRYKNSRTKYGCELKEPK